MQPGDTINPGEEKPKEAAQPQAEQPQSAPPAAVAEQPAPEPQQAPAETEAPEPDGQWQFSTEDTPDTQPAPKSHEPVNWTASEYVAHEKSASWYLLLGLMVIASAGLVFVLTGERISSIVIVIMGAAFGAFAVRKPQELDYRIDNTALHVGNRSYVYAQFKSFTVVDEGPIHSVMLMPMQRFMPPLSIYYAPEDEAKITEALSSYLPYEDRKQDVVDKFMRKIRF